MIRRAPWIVAGLFSVFHVFFVALPVISTGGHGEGQALAVAIFDFPLVALMQRTHTGSCILYGCVEASAIPYEMFIPIVGTLMYGIAGFVGGVVLRRLVLAGARK